MPYVLSARSKRNYCGFRSATAASASVSASATSGGPAAGGSRVAVTTAE